MLPLANAAQRILDSVVSLEAETYKIGYQQCAVSDGCLHPQNPLDAKFSLPFTLAGALLLGQVDQSLFTSEKVADPAIRTLLGRIRDGGLPGPLELPGEGAAEGRPGAGAVHPGSHRVVPEAPQRGGGPAEGGGATGQCVSPPGRPGGEEVIELAGSGKAAGGVRCVAGCEPSVPLKGGKDPLAGRGSHIGYGTLPPAIRLVPLPFQGRTKYINSHRIPPISPMGVQVLEML